MCGSEFEQLSFDVSVPCSLSWLYALCRVGLGAGRMEEH